MGQRAKETAGVIRAVLDTNVLVSALLFTAPLPPGSGMASRSAQTGYFRRCIEGIRASPVLS